MSSASTANSVTPHSQSSSPVDAVMTWLTLWLPMRIGANSGSLPKHLAELAQADQAEALVEAALDHARANGLKVEPRCAYAASYMDRHPESMSLRA